MIGVDLIPSAYLARCSEVLNTVDTCTVERLAQEIHAAYVDGRFVFLCGNGGSASNASPTCEDFAKSTLDRKDFGNDSVRRLKVLSLTDNTAGILAWGNDEGFDRIFVEQLKTYASPDDMLIAISGSGNSPNVLNAVEWANHQSLRTWGITGFSGGKLHDLAQEVIHVPVDDMGLVESIHLLLFHWILDDVHARIYRTGRHARPATRSGNNSRGAA